MAKIVNLGKKTDETTVCIVWHIVYLINCDNLCCDSTVYERFPLLFPDYDTS